MLNINEVLDRIKGRLNLKTDADLFRHLGHEGQQKINGWRKRNTIPWVEIHNLSVEQNWSMDWLLTGKDPTPHECPIKCNEELRDLCGKLKEIMTDPVYEAGIKANLLCFEDAIKTKRELANMKAAQSDGQGGGTAEIPAKRTAKRSKAG